MPPVTLLHIRYYDQHLLPTLFVGKGWRGWAIRILNLLRYWLETFIQYQVLKLGIEASMPTAEPEVKKAYLRAFREDVKVERRLLSEESPISSPSPSSLSIFYKREERYKRGREERVIQEDEVSTSSSPPSRIDALASRLGQPTRTQRYGRTTVVVEDEVEPVEVSTTKKE